MEPFSERHPRKSSWEASASPCLNCERELIGPYCHHCGQKDQDLDVRFSQLATDWLGGMVGFDARIWPTLRVLFRRPGQLTLEFLEGRRARYVAPLRLYLVASLAMFATMTWFDVSVFNSSSGMINISSGPDEEMPEEIAKKIEAMESIGGFEINKELTTVGVGSDGDGVPGPGTEDPDRAKATGPAAASASGNSTAPDLTDGGSIDVDATDAGSVSPDPAGDELETGAESPEPGGVDDAEQQPGPADEEADDVEGAEDAGDSESPSGDSFVHGVIDGVGDSFENLEQATKDEKRFSREFREQLPKMLFLLVPVFALQLRVLFRRRFKRYIHHLIFSLHAHAAVFFMVAATRPLDAFIDLPGGTFGDFAGLVFLGYLFLALRRTYGDSRIKSGVKLMILLFVHMIMLSFSLIAALLVTASRLQAG
ncbi:MAG: DUF3667 domain-containing protein [Acidobacteriota bacterium]